MDATTCRRTRRPTTRDRPATAKVCRRAGVNSQEQASLAPWGGLRGRRHGARRASECVPRRQLQTAGRSDISARDFHSADRPALAKPCHAVDFHPATPLPMQGAGQRDMAATIGPGLHHDCTHTPINPGRRQHCTTPPRQAAPPCTRHTSAPSPANTSPHQADPHWPPALPCPWRRPSPTPPGGKYE